MRVGSTGSKPTAGVKDASQLTRSEQDEILRMVAAEKASAKKSSKSGKPGVTPKYGVQPPVTPKYGVKPPEVTPKYAVVPGPVVAKYAVVPPWAGVDAHQAVINKVVKDGYLNAKEATTLAKLFNRDIAEAQKDGRDIRKQVADFLHSVLDKVKMSQKSKDIVFGPGGPGYVDHGPIYIVAPGGNKPGPIYIMGPGKKK